MLKISMKTFFLAAITLTLTIISPLTASPGKGNNSLDILKKEVVQLFQKYAVQFPDIPDQEVTVGFLINARNELIVIDINGDSASACEYVKQVLNYNRVKYNQEKQLTRYTITIHLVKEKD